MTPSGFIDKNAWPVHRAVMHLITMAHLGEAQGVIETFKLKRTQNDLFQNEDMLLLLTGEGPFEATASTAFILGKFPCDEVINLGIAGTLSDDVKLGEIYPVRTHYLIQEMKPAFKSFTGNPQGIDCLTAFERILNPERAQSLKGLGHLVDREAWGVAYAAKEANVPFRSFKLISDKAGTLGACELIKDEAHDFSLKLASFLSELLDNKKEMEETRFDLKGFHFTFTTAHKFQTLLKKLSIKREKTLEETFEALPTADYLQLKVTPKERAKLLLDSLESELDPLRGSLMSAKEKWLRDVQKSGIEVQTDPEWEHNRVSVRFDVEDDHELSRKLKVLESFSLRPFKDLMEGKLHVE